MYTTCWSLLLSYVQIVMCATLNSLNGFCHNHMRTAAAQAEANAAQKSSKAWIPKPGIASRAQPETSVHSQADYAELQAATGRLPAEQLAPSAAQTKEGQPDMAGRQQPQQADGLFAPYEAHQGLKAAWALWDELQELLTVQRHWWPHSLFRHVTASISVPCTQRSCSAVADMPFAACSIFQHKRQLCNACGKAVPPTLCM